MDTGGVTMGDNPGLVDMVEMKFSYQATTVANWKPGNVANILSIITRSPD